MARLQPGGQSVIKTSSGGGLHPVQFDSLAASKMTRSQFDSITAGSSHNGPEDSLLFGDMPSVNEGVKQKQRRFKNNNHSTLEDNQNETIESASTNQGKRRNEATA